MPRKKKTSAESEPATAESAAQPSAEPDAAAIEPGDDVPRARRRTPAKTSGKPAAKKRAAGKSGKKVAKAEATEAAAVGAHVAEGAQPAEAEAAAHAADTFDEAFEANDLRETRTSIAAAEGAAMAARVTCEAGAHAQDQPAEPPEEEPDESDELEGDWESGSGDEREEEEERRQSLPANQQRLQKILAAAGIASRRHAEELILEGRVQVNGQVVTKLGSKADPARDHIRVDGKLIHGAERLRYFVLNKPRGYVTTVSDPEGRPTVMQFFSKMGERLYPVGRLDYQSEGLLLMTNDGELANQLTRAASEVEKVYLVKVSGQPDAEKIEALREGVRIDRGRRGEGRVQTAPARIRQIREGENPWFEVGLIEGRNRELRKMFEEIGHHVEKIRRVGYGPLELDLEPGKMRELTPEEVQALRLAAEGKLKAKPIRASSKLPREAGRTVDFEADKHRRRPAGRYQGQRQGERRPQREGFRERGREDRRPQGGFEQPNERRGPGDFARGERAGFAAGDRSDFGRSERSGFAGPEKVQKPWRGQRQGQTEGRRGEWQDRRQGQRPPRHEDQGRGEEGSFVRRTQGQRPWQAQRHDTGEGRRAQWQDRRQGQRPPRTEDQARGDQRPRPQREGSGGRRSFREGSGFKPQRGGEERREGRGFGGENRRGFGGESRRGVGGASRPNRAGSDRGERGGFTPRPEGERGAAPPRGGRFGKPGGGSKPGGRPFAGGKPGGRSGRKPGGFGKGRPR